MGSKNPARDKKKAPAQSKQAKPAEKPKAEPANPPKKPAAEAKDSKAQTGKKRPASEPERAVPPYQPETSELEKKRLQVAEELRKVEQQIFDLETKYLDQSSAYGNAVRGYEGFLGGLSQANRKGGIKPDERLFSMSSCSTVPH